MYEMMDMTESLAKIYNTTPFEVMIQEAEHVIMVINYLSEKADEAPATAKGKGAPKNQKGDFWDF